MAPVPLLLKEHYYEDYVTKPEDFQLFTDAPLSAMEAANRQVVLSRTATRILISHSYLFHLHSDLSDHNRHPVGAKIVQEIIAIYSENTAVIDTITKDGGRYNSVHAEAHAGFQPSISSSFEPPTSQVTKLNLLTHFLFSSPLLLNLIQNITRAILWHSFCIRVHDF